jgi:hypothetical protein
MYGFVAALKAQTAIAFKERLRAIDVLVIDDIQFLQGKSIQQEFFARLPLGVERIEFLLEALVGRFAGVDRAADVDPGPGVISPRHRSAPPLSESPAAAP